jgi:hypothetical protein
MQGYRVQFIDDPFYRNASSATHVVLRGRLACSGPYTKAVIDVISKQHRGIQINKKVLPNAMKNETICSLLPALRLT